MSIFDQFDTAEREREQAEAVREAEVTRLEKAEDLRSFRRLRSEQAVAEPDKALDECSYRDYRIRRDAGEGRD